MSSRLRAIARETVDIAERGTYRAADGEVLIGAQVARAVAGTRLYLPDEDVAVPAPVGGTPTIEVTNESTLTATRRLGGDLACLVFASARNPGGGFLNGAQAQEESLARGSALYPCLRAAGDFYAHHRTHSELTYSDRVIYSPSVPVFRDDKGALLPAPYPVSFLTAAAPNRSAIARSQPQHLADLPAALARRAARILQVAATHGHRRLVLGAWGCGVFGNDPVTVATAFATALRHSPWFDEVVFAVLDRQPATPTHAAFAGILLSGAGPRLADRPLGASG
ncbi:TIGR02452 family protein [Micromonospora sp. B11E3]|uniref:TIGR02452 family protein n=1 Tax=Micromonospora sp. B11E3 TaxID=3153562 RepID=UPI00325DFB0C